MSRNKQKKPKCLPFEGAGKYIARGNQVKGDTCARIFESMARSDAYKDLKSRQRDLYTHCKLQYYGKRKPKQDYPDIGIFDDETFYMNFNEVVETYGLYTKSMCKEFYRDMRELAEHGFIRKLSQGGGIAHKKNIYVFIDEWQTWKPGERYTKNYPETEKQPGKKKAKVKTDK